jgi:L-2-hydroxycarboxylate dehydrogenase (NAD+)
MAKVISFETVGKFIEDVLLKAGIPSNDAAVVADALLQADKLGFDTHGVNRLKNIYLDRIKIGILNPVTEIEILRDGPTTAVVDGHNGMGHVIASKSMKMAIEKAGKYGMGMVAVRNSTHYGFAGYYALMAVRENMIGITGTNARPAIAPTFGVENMLGTNPLTFGIPSDEEFPFLLDCATSIIQRGKVELYARENREMHEGLVIDENGQSKTNSREVLSDLLAGRAALTPLGGIGEETAGYKGYGYATVVEILSAALQQGAFLQMLTGFRDGKPVPYPLGHFFIVIDINAFTDIDSFKKTTGDILRELRASKKMPGHDRIFTAGQKEFETWIALKDKGISFSDQLLDEFLGLCFTYGLPEYQNLFSSK